MNTPCPRCQTVSEFDFGIEAVCDVCGHAFTPSAPMAKPAATKTSNALTGFLVRVVADAKTSNAALTGSMLCFLAGVVFVAFGLGWFFVFVPLFLVAFVLSIVAIAQKQIVRGLLMLLMTLLCPLIAVGISYGFHYPIAAKPEGSTRAIEIVEWSVGAGNGSDTGSVRAPWKFHLKNNSGRAQTGTLWLIGLDKNGFQCYENVYQSITKVPPNGEVKQIREAFFARGEYGRIESFITVWR